MIFICHLDFFMLKFQTIVVDNTEVELTYDLIERYKNTTRKKRVTKRGIEKFYNRLISFNHTLS